MGAMSCAGDGWLHGDKGLASLGPFSGAPAGTLGQVKDTGVIASGWLYSVYMLMSIRWLLDVLFLVTALVPAVLGSTVDRCLRGGISHMFYVLVNLGPEVLSSCSPVHRSWHTQNGEVCTVVASVFLSVLFTLGNRTLCLQAPC